MSAGSVERRLAAILAADVVGYSRLMGGDEVGTLRALQSHRRALIDPLIAAHRGRLVKTTGDGLLLEFASVVDAVGCGVAIQRGMLARNEAVPEAQRIVLRMGINVGDIIIDGGDIFGDGVNVAARLETLCEPGGLCISQSANEQVRDKMALAFSDRGEQMVKNIARAVGMFGLSAAEIAVLPVPELPALPPAARRSFWPVIPVAAVCALAGLAGWWSMRQPASVAPATVLADRRMSVAVLAFGNASGDASQNSVATQLTQDVRAQLAEFPGVPVVSSEAAGTSVDAPALGRALDVHFILTGTTRTENGRLIATATLVEAAPDRKVWNDRIDLLDGPRAAATMAERIAHDTQQAAIDAEVARARREHPNGGDARDVYLSAQLSGLQPLTRENRRSQLALMDKALALDPGFTPAALGAAGLRAVILRNDWSADRAADIASGTQAVEALAAARPHDATVLAVQANLLAAQGRVDEALAVNRSLSEIAPDRWQTYRDGGVLLFGQQKWREALASFREARKRLPTNYGAYELDGQIAAALLASGQFARASETASRAVGEVRAVGDSAFSDRVWLILIAAQAVADQDDAARASLARYLATSRQLKSLSQVRASPDDAQTPHLLDGLRRAGMTEE